MSNEINELFGRPVPRLGFGCMRLPEGEDGEYIEEECQQMSDYAMAHGLNYQTAMPDITVPETMESDADAGFMPDENSSRRLRTRKC